MGVEIVGDTTIRVDKVTKKKLEALSFVKKGHSYNNIVEELIDFYKKKEKFN